DAACAVAAADLEAVGVELGDVRQVGGGLLDDSEEERPLVGVGVGGLGCHLDVVRGGHVVAVAPGVGGEVAGLEGGGGLGVHDDAGLDVEDVQACLHGCPGGGVDAGDADLGVSGGEVLGDRGVGAQRVGHGDCLGVLVVVQGVLAVGEGLVAGGAGLGGLPVVEVDVDEVTAAFEEQGVHGGPDGE